MPVVGAGVNAIGVTRHLEPLHSVALYDVVDIPEVALGAIPAAVTEEELNDRDPAVGANGHNMLAHPVSDGVRQGAPEAAHILGAQPLRPTPAGGGQRQLRLLEGWVSTLSRLHSDHSLHSDQPGWAGEDNFVTGLRYLI